MVDIWFSNSNLLSKSKEERAEVISRLLFTFVLYKLQSSIRTFLIHFNAGFNIMNYDVTSLENIIQSHFESMQCVIKK